MPLDPLPNAAQSVPIRPEIRLSVGQEVKTAFTKSEARRYESWMVLFASLALAAAALAVPLERVEPQAVAPVRQAQATVTILPAARLRFSDIERDQPRLLRESVVRGGDGRWKC